MQRLFLVPLTGQVSILTRTFHVKIRKLVWREGVNMGYCIYYKKSDQHLHFDKEEHVIPAGLGGIQKLKKGAVSDEANEKFSKLETVVLRNSLIGFNRMNNGPGKRGSHNVKKVTSPVMRVLKQEKGSPVEFVLGFIFKGQSYIIPQLILDFDIKTNTFLPMYMSTVLDEQSIGDFPLDLDRKLIQLFKNKKITWKLVQLPFETKKHFINIGHYQGKWYATTSFKKIHKNLLALDMLPMLNEKVKEPEDKNELSKPEILGEILLNYKDKLNTDASTFYFMYLKTAFNALALFKGTDYVCNEIFDEIRESIIKVRNVDKFIQSEKDLYDSEIEVYAKNFPDKAHYVIICAKDNRLIAYVSFYGEPPGKVILKDKYQGENFIDGLICDWENREEFRLENSRV